LSVKETQDKLVLNILCVGTNSRRHMPLCDMSLIGVNDKISIKNLKKEKIRWDEIPTWISI